MYYARLVNPHNPKDERLFEIVGYEDGKYMVWIDFVFPMKLNRIVWKQESE